MARRSHTFVSPARRMLLERLTSHIEDAKIDGPLPWLNPTRARVNLSPHNAEEVGAQVDGAEAAPVTRHGEQKTVPSPDGAQIEWRARDNRKGRHALVIPGDSTTTEGPQVTSEWSAVGKGIWRMCTVFAWWDVSWWIAVLFSVGSAIFVISAFWYWLPLEAPSTKFPGEELAAGGVASAVGATLFQIGAVLLIFEACNENQTGCFGWALQRAFSHDGDNDSTASPAAKEAAADSAPKPTAGYCDHHHIHGIHHRSTVEKQHPSARRTWEWWPTWHECTSHYFHEIGWLASIIEAIGATIFYISGLMALPGIYNNLSQPVLWYVYWLAYLVGGILFVIASLGYVLESQKNWYTPAPHLLGWHIGVWNTIGSVGWVLSASFGYCSASWCGYQSDLSLLWASVAYLIGSLLLWYEALDKYPVERERKTK
ncbi:uncharacterized protein LTR77_007798 [Saxophila tyrrhenica]|uniref:Integral membrane protein n=1 Tax=Saxophila tyrrhenica TaxID=1690608 RepID=A0AAV9P737_9PEZI|nr:hypothetical protein LTR77_007798 [Saxophila tyrrhenica]